MRGVRIARRDRPDNAVRALSSTVHSRDVRWCDEVTRHELALGVIAKPLKSGG